jgi:DNA-binding MarR family transcriptional regulator
VHGFAFTPLAGGDVTVTDLAEHPDVTRQAAAQIADYLVAKGYVVRLPHPVDGRARLVVFTEKGWACTRAAEAAMTEVVEPWAAVLGEERLHALLAACRPPLHRPGRPGAPVVVTASRLIRLFFVKVGCRV